jgi:hypothetical protein
MLGETCSTTRGNEIMYRKINISFAETLAIEAEAMGEYTEAQILYSNAALEARKANYFKDHERLSAKAKEMFGLALINAK